MSGQAGRAGFVLAGGPSSRMGRDKALLPLDGELLLERVAERVKRGRRKRHPDRSAGALRQDLGYPVSPTECPTAVRLGGVYHGA